MKDVLPALDAWVATGERAVLATVVAVRRSAPRPPGSKMAISASGQVSGMVSGGCVEGPIVETAKAVLDGDQPRLLHFGIPDEDAWDVGLPCGGEIDVWVERFETPQFADIARAGGRAALVTAVRGSSAGRRLLVREDGSTEGDLDHPLALDHAKALMWSERSELRDELFVDVTGPPPRLIIFGAISYAQSLSRLARACGWTPYVVDPRRLIARADRFPDAEAVVARWPDEALATIGGIDRATYIAVLTHDPKLDDAALELALRSEAPYIGAMGSRRANLARRERLRALGFSDENIARIASPIGLDLGALTAEEIALSILAEITAVRRGRNGGRLMHANGRIHEVAA
jgi:xanthine dehydrogenase accessory factor